LEEFLGRLRNPLERPREPTARAVFLEDFSSDFVVGFGICNSLEVYLGIFIYFWLEAKTQVLAGDGDWKLAGVQCEEVYVKK